MSSVPERSPGVLDLSSLLRCEFRIAVRSKVGAVPVDWFWEDDMRKQSGNRCVDQPAGKVVVIKGG